MAYLRQCNLEAVNSQLMNSLNSGHIIQSRVNHLRGYNTNNGFVVINTILTILIKLLSIILLRIIYIKFINKLIK